MSRLFFCPCCQTVPAKMRGGESLFSRRRFLTLSGSGVAAMGLGALALPRTARAQDYPYAGDGGGANPYDAAPGNASPDAQAQAANPSVAGGAQVLVTAMIDPVQYDFSRSLPELQEIARNSNVRNIQEGRQQTVGLAVGELGVNFSSEDRLVQYPDGRCEATIASIRIDLEISNNTIYVIRELEEGSCPHDEVLRHEQTHKEIDRHLMDEFQNIGQTTFSTIASQIGTVHAQSPDEAKAMLSDSLTQCLNGYVQNLHDARAERQAAFDSPAEYHRLSLSCGGQLERIVSSSIRR